MKFIVDNGTLPTEALKLYSCQISRSKSMKTIFVWTKARYVLFLACRPPKGCKVCLSHMQLWAQLWRVTVELNLGCCLKPVTRYGQELCIFRRQTWWKVKDTVAPQICITLGILYRQSVSSIKSKSFKNVYKRESNCTTFVVFC